MKKDIEGERVLTLGWSIERNHNESLLDSSEVK